MSDTNNNNKKTDGDAPQSSASKFDHFKKEEELALKRGFFLQLTDAIEEWRGKMKKPDSGGDDGDAAAAGAAAPKKAAKPRLSKKQVTIAGIAVVVVVLAALIIPQIPVQIQRSAGFAAYADGDYAGAYSELRNYLSIRPNDHQAAYRAAVSGLFTGDTEYARNIFAGLYDKRLLPEQTDILYYYALTNMSEGERALDVLNSLLAANSDHVGGRLLRGLLLSQEDGMIRNARDDFLQADNILNTQADTTTDLTFLHQFLQKSGSRALTPAEADTPTVEPGWLDNVGVTGGWEGHISRFSQSYAGAFSGESLSPRTILFLNFAYVLMEQGLLKEAEGELKSATADSAGELSVAQAEAFLALYQGDYPLAITRFEAILEALPQDDAVVLNNLAIARWFVDSDISNIGTVLEIYDRAIAADPQNVVAINNSGYLMLVQGNAEEAQARLAAEGTEIPEPPVSLLLNRAFAYLALGQSVAALEIFNQISENEFPDVLKYRYFVLKQAKRYDEALALLYRLIKAKPDDAELKLLQAGLYRELNEQRVAYGLVLSALVYDPQNLAALYQAAELALMLNEGNRYTVMSTNLQSLVGEDDHRMYALRGLQAQLAGDANAAIDFYQSAIERAPNDRIKNRYLGPWALLQAEFSTANAADTLMPVVEQGRQLELGAILSYVAADINPVEAAAYAQAVIAAPRATFTAKKYAGIALVKTGDFTAALTLLNDAREWLPADREIAQARVTALSETGQDYDANVEGDVLANWDTRFTIRHDESIKMEVIVPRSQKALFELFKTAVQNPNADDTPLLDGYAAEEARLSEEEPDKLPQLHYSRATYHTFKGNNDAAAADFHRAVTEGGLSDETQQRDALLFYKKLLEIEGKYQQLVPVYDLLIAHEPENALYYRLRASVQLLHLGEEAKGETGLMATLEKFPGDVSSYFLLAGIHQQDAAAALPLFRKAVRTAPNYPEVYTRLSTYYQSLGLVQDAQSYSLAHASFDTSAAASAADSDTAN